MHRRFCAVIFAISTKGVIPSAVEGSAVASKRCTRVVLAHMNRLHPYYDRISRNYSLNWAIAITVIFSFICCMSFFQFFKYFQQHQSFYLILSPFNFLLGLAGIFQGAQITHAVMRRLVGQSAPAGH